MIHTKTKREARFCRLSALGKQIGKEGSLINGSQFIADLQRHVALGQGRTSNAGRFLGTEPMACGCSDKLLLLFKVCSEGSISRVFSLLNASKMIMRRDHSKPGVSEVARYSPVALIRLP